MKIDNSKSLCLLNINKQKQAIHYLPDPVEQVQRFTYGATDDKTLAIFSSAVTTTLG